MMNYNYDQNKTVMTEVLKSWSEKQETWAEGFLSWDRENKQAYGGFPDEFEAKAKEKGINLIIDRHFDLHLLDRPDRFSHLYPISFVLLSEDYVKSETCMRELLLMHEYNRTPRAIHYFTDEDEQQEDTYSRFARFRSIAAKTTNRDEEDVALDFIFTTYFFGDFQPNNQPLSADRPLSVFIYQVLVSPRWFPHYGNFPALDFVAKRVFDLITRPISEALPEVSSSRKVKTKIKPSSVGYDIMYVGLMGSSANCNKFVAENICLPHRLSALNFTFKHIEIIDYRAQMGLPFVTKPYEDLFSWGLMLANSIRKVPIPMHMTVHDVYRLLVDSLPKQKCVLFLENIPYYYKLKALANVFDFLSPGSRIVFTTTNEDTFSERLWTSESHMTGVPTIYSVKGQMLDTDELEHLEKIQRDRSVMVPKQQTQQDSQVM